MSGSIEELVVMRVGNRLAFFNKGSSLYPSLVFGNKIYFELPRSTYKHPPPLSPLTYFLCLYLDVAVMFWIMMANYQDVLGNCLPIKNLGTNPILLCYISFFSKYRLFI